LLSSEYPTQAFQPPNVIEPSNLESLPTSVFSWL